MASEMKPNHAISAEASPFSTPEAPFTQALSMFGMPWAGLQQSSPAAPGLPPALAQLGLMQIEVAEAYLTGVRRIIDLWRASVRDQQDQLLASWRAQLAPQAAHRLQPDPPARSIPPAADGADQPQRSVTTSRRNRVDHAETTVLAREH